MSISITAEELFSRFADSVNWLYTPSNTGLSAIAAMALLIWRANALGASRAQIDALILRKDSDHLMREKFSKALALARVWSTSELPDQIKGASSDNAARKAALTWLYSKDIRSQDDLPKLWSGAVLKRDGQVERLSNSIAAALRSSDRSSFLGYEYTPAEFAVAIIEKLPLHQATEFCRAATDALTAKSLE